MSPSEIQASPLDPEEGAMLNTQIKTNVEEMHHMMQMQAETTKDQAMRINREHWDRYRNPVNGMLLAATFAGTVTLGIILTPRDTSTSIPGIAELAYASSLFLGSVMGCILIIASIELGMERWTVGIEMCVVGATLYVAFYLLLLASSLLLSYRGPFILGSIFYIGCGFLMLAFIVASWIQRRRLWKSNFAVRPGNIGMV